MKTPGFSAENSLYRVDIHYQQSANHRRDAQLVTPSMIVGGGLFGLSCWNSCFWDLIRCLGAGGTSDPYCGIYYRLCLTVCDLTGGVRRP